MSLLKNVDRCAAALGQNYSETGFHAIVSWPSPPPDNYVIDLKYPAQNPQYVPGKQGQPEFWYKYGTVSTDCNHLVKLPLIQQYLLGKEVFHIVAPPQISSFDGMCDNDAVVCRLCPLDCNGGTCVFNDTTGLPQCNCESAPTRAIASCWGADGDAPPNDAHVLNTVRSGKYCEVESLPNRFVTTTKNNFHQCVADTGDLQCVPGTTLITLNEVQCPSKTKADGGHIVIPTFQGNMCGLDGDANQGGLEHACDR
jgi:hypothetical protein